MNTEYRWHAAHLDGKDDHRDDLLRAYLVDLQSHEMLPAEQQLAIARLLREHRTSYRQALLATGLGQRGVLSLLRATQNKQLRLQQFCELSFRDQAQQQAIRQLIAEAADILQGNLASNDRAMSVILCDDLAPDAKRRLGVGITQRLKACAGLLLRIPFRQRYFDDVLEQIEALLHAMQTRLRLIRSLARYDRPTAEPLVQEMRLMIKGALCFPGQLALQLQRAAEYKSRFEEHVGELARGNLRLVISIAKQYRNRGLSFLDLIQDGNAGLIESLTRFDERMGCRVSSYAVWWIRQAIIKSLEKHSRHVRLPLEAGHLAAQIAADAERIFKETGSRPSVERLASTAGVSSNVVQAVLRASEQPVSLTLPLDEASGDTVCDALSDHREADARYVLELSEILQCAVEALAHLTEKERTLLRLRYGLDDGKFHSFRELSSVFSLSPQRLQQIERQALRRLRAKLENG